MSATLRLVSMQSTIEPPTPSFCINKAHEHNSRTISIYNDNEFSTKKVNRETLRFSIEEILKPSFGENKSKSPSTCNSQQPLDMRITPRHKVKSATSENENTCHEVNCAVSPDQSISADELGSSRSSSPSSRDSYSPEYEEFCRKYKLQFENRRDCPRLKESTFNQNDLQFLATSSYYNALNHIYNYDVTAHQLYNQFQPMKNFINPHTTYPNIPSIHKCSHFYTEFAKDYRIFSKGIDDVSVLAFNSSTATSESYRGLKLNLTNSRQNGLSVKNFNEGIYSDSEINSGKFTQEKNICKNSNTENKDSITGSEKDSKDKKHLDQFVWPAWVYCTRYSDRPSSGPRYRKPRARSNSQNDKRPRTAFSTQQLQRLTREFETNPYLSENRRQTLAFELRLTESQVKIWFQNKRAKLKKSSGCKNLLAQRLLQEGLYNHSTIVIDDEDNNKSDNIK